MSLRTRTAIVVGFAVAIAVGLAAATAHEVADRALSRQIDDFLVQRAELGARSASELAQRGPGRGRPRSVIAEFLTTPDAVVQIVDRQGQLALAVADAPQLPVGPQERSVLGDSKAGPILITVDIDGVRYRVITHPIGSGAVQVGRSLEETDRALSLIDRRLLILGLAGTVLAAITGWVVAQRAVAPIAALTAKAERVAATQDLSEPIDAGGPEEISRLGQAFNSMLAALELSRLQQRRLIQDASHELRTPLTSLRTNVDVLARRYNTMSEQIRAQILDDLVAETEEMTELVAELVQYATGQASEAAPESETLLAIAQGVAARYSRRRGQPIEVHRDETRGPIEAVLLVPDQIERAISNLVANSVKFSPDGASIALVVSTRSVECRDRGPGVPPEDLERIFDRFYRRVEWRDQPGSGLGLAIVEQIVKGHGGRVWARNRPRGGAAIGFEIT